MNKMFKSELKGKLVRPSRGLDDKGFIYVSSLDTNLAETFRRAREVLGERKREKLLRGALGLDS